MVELEEQLSKEKEKKKKIDSDDVSKKKKKEAKKSKKEDGQEEAAEPATADGKDKKKTKVKKDKPEATPVEATKSPKPKKPKKVVAPEQEGKDDKTVKKKKKETDENPQEEPVPEVGEVALKDETTAPPKLKKKKSKKNLMDETSEDAVEEEEMPLKDDAPAPPKLKKKKSKKNLMAEVSDDEIELKSDHHKKKKTRKHGIGEVGDDGENKTKVKKSKKTPAGEPNVEEEAKAKSKKSTTKAPDASSEDTESDKKKKKKKTVDSPDSVEETHGTANVEPSSQPSESETALPPSETGLSSDPPKEPSAVEQDQEGEESPKEETKDGQQATPCDDAAKISEAIPANPVSAGSETLQEAVTDIQTVQSEEKSIEKKPDEKAADVSSDTVGDTTTIKSDATPSNVGETHQEAVTDTQTVQSGEKSIEKKPDEKAADVSSDTVGNTTTTKSDGTPSNVGEPHQEAVTDTQTEQSGEKSIEKKPDEKAADVSSDTVGDTTTTKSDGTPSNVGEPQQEAVTDIQTEQIEKKPDEKAADVSPETVGDTMTTKSDDTPTNVGKADESPESESSTSRITPLVDIKESPVVAESELAQENPAEKEQEQAKNESIPPPLVEEADVRPNEKPDESTALEGETEQSTVDETHKEPKEGPEPIDHLEQAATTSEADKVTELPKSEPPSDVVDKALIGDASVVESGPDKPSTELNVETPDLSPTAVEEPASEVIVPSPVPLVSSDTEKEQQSPIMLLDAKASTETLITPDPSLENVEQCDSKSGDQQVYSIVAASEGSQQRNVVANEDDTRSTLIAQPEENHDHADLHKSAEETKVAAEKTSQDTETRATGDPMPTQDSENYKNSDQSQTPIVAEIESNMASTSTSVTEESKEINHALANASVPSDCPKELLVICEAMTTLVQDDESSSKEMNRLKEQLLILFGAMHEERTSLHARLQEQEAELSKSEDKIGMLEDEIEKQLADWDLLEVKLGQADVEIRKLLEENQRLENELEEVTKGDSNGDPTDFATVNESLKKFSDEIATAKTELEEAQKRMDQL